MAKPARRQGDAERSLHVPAEGHRARAPEGDPRHRPRPCRRPRHLDAGHRPQPRHPASAANYVNRFSLEGRSYKVVPQVEQRFRLEPEQLQDYYLRTASGGQVPLGSLVQHRDDGRAEQAHPVPAAQQPDGAGIDGAGGDAGRRHGVSGGAGARAVPARLHLGLHGQLPPVRAARQRLGRDLLHVPARHLPRARRAIRELGRDPLIILVSVPMSIAGRSGLPHAGLRLP